MAFDTMIFILGALLLGAGLFGGGLEIKELKLPTISGVARMLCGAMGGVFIVLALSIDLKWLPEAQGQERPGVISVPPQASSQTFDAPDFEGKRLDACLVWAARCGEEAATAWCRQQGFSHATLFTTENVGSRGIETKLIGSRQVCNAPFCSAFARITCAR